MTDGPVGGVGRGGGLGEGRALPFARVNRQGGVPGPVPDPVPRSSSPSQPHTNLTHSWVPLLQVVLAEKQQCPFTNQPLQFEQLKLLTKTNIHLHRDKIVNGTPATLAS